MSEYQQCKERAKDVFIAIIYKESQVFRPLGKRGTNVDNGFRTKVFAACKRLREIVDQDSIKTQDIRQEIENMSRVTNTSIGQSQKVINVFLKFYCLITNKTESLIRELDCPLDRNSIRKLVPQKERKALKDIKSIDDYLFYQRKAEEQFGVRLFADEPYDMQRLALYNHDVSE